jgi:prevent-host-death family protein
MSHMEAVGVRELRRYASRWLARVRAGESFVVTDRGRPIARLTPLADPVGYQALLNEGRIAPGSGRTATELVAELDATLPSDRGASVSDALASLRDDER